MKRKAGIALEFPDGLKETDGFERPLDNADKEALDAPHRRKKMHKVQDIIELEVEPRLRIFEVGRCAAPQQFPVVSAKCICFTPEDLVRSVPSS